MKKILLHVTLGAMMISTSSCSAPSRPGAHGSSVPSLAEFIQESADGTKIVCKQNGFVSFEGRSIGAVNASAQHLIYRDRTSKNLVFISTMNGQCQVTALSSTNSLLSEFPKTAEPHTTDQK